MADAGVSELFKLYGAQAAAEFKKEKDTEPVIYGSGLPPVEFRGVAKVSRWEFTKTKDGALMFLGAGQIVYPRACQDQYLEGCETKQFVTVDPSDFQAANRQIMNHCKTVFGPDCLKGFPDGTTVFQAVEALAKVAKAKAVHFRVETEFREEKIDPKTGSPYPKNVWERWKGNVPNFVPPGSTVAPAPSTNGHAPAAPWGERAKSVPVTPSVAPMPEEKKPAPVKAPPPAPKEPETFPLDGGSPKGWKELIARAQAKDAEADSELRAMCIAIGKTEDEIDEASWGDIESWLTLVPSADEPPDTGFAPEEGSVCQYRAPDPKDETGTKRLRVCQCEVAELNADARLMTLVKFSDRSKKWVGVSWDDPHVEYPKD